jgi:hypothetical protein
MKVVSIAASLALTGTVWVVKFACRCCLEKSNLVIRSGPADEEGERALQDLGGSNGADRALEVAAGREDLDDTMWYPTRWQNGEDWRQAWAKVWMLGRRLYTEPGWPRVQAHKGVQVRRGEAKGDSRKCEIVKVRR